MILVGLLFVSIKTKKELGGFVIGFVAGTGAGITIWGNSWILEQLKWGYKEKGILGIIGGNAVIILLALLLWFVLLARGHKKRKEEPENEH
ncbi:hypothetical protein [Thermococcus henrietii]|uniref:hypothetical protein n=1 Tax=Thermococcus henrietii TaxID=2016361 RepID=UPI0011AB2D4C|nr:hypothetical protein [Thermococcus henrietii]